METLALSHRPIPSASFPHLSTPSGHHASSSLTLSRSSPSRLCTLRCSVLSSRSQAGGADDHWAKFREAAEHGNLIPLYRIIFADHLTPVVTFRRLVKEDERDAPSFLFESVDRGLQASSVVSTFFPKSEKSLFL